MSFCVLSLYVPVAVNCCVAPTAIKGDTGVTAIDVRVAAAVTVNVTGVLTTVPIVAVIVDVPTLTAVASPVVATIVATAGVPEFQVT